MLIGEAALKESGMPALHAQVFQKVANSSLSVIASRAVGKYATGLLLESYATKGFHNKAKSCNWGPMAGFVLSDPRFTKNKDTSGQRSDLASSFSHGAGEIPVYITNERKQDLEGPLGCMARTLGAGNINSQHYTARTPDGGSMKFILERAMNAPGAAGKQLWAVCYGAAEKVLPGTLAGPGPKTPANLIPIMAMVDPSCPGDVKRTYRAATTGDYDLFAIFPPRADYNRQGADKRMVPGSDRFQTPMSQFNKHEDAHKGNLTPRIAAIARALNGGCRAVGYMGGDVVHHSDEVGRPKITSVDFPFISFIPGQHQPYCSRNLTEFSELLQLLQFQYVVTLNPGWHKQMGLSTSAGGSYTV